MSTHQRSSIAPLLLGVGVPLLELVLLFRVGAEIGGLEVLYWVILSAFLGGWIMRTQRQGLLQRLQLEIGAGHMPGGTVIEGLVVLGAGLALILPGLITDALGVLLLIPPVRRFAAAKLRGRFSKGGRGGVFFQVGGFGAQPGGTPGGTPGGMPGGMPGATPGGNNPFGRSADGVPIKDVQAVQHPRPSLDAPADEAEPPESGPT